MARTTQTEHVRFRYGICLNEKCDECKSKRVQQISVRKDFVCEACGKNLMECPPPPPPVRWKLIVGGVATVAVIAMIVIGMNWKSCSRGQTPPVDTVDIPKDTVKGGDTLTGRIADPFSTPKAGKELPIVMNGYGTIHLGYGIYTGQIKNGKPHGQGTIKYTQRHKIVSSQDFVANPGDEFEGDFRDGRISSIGYWKHDGNETPVKP